MQQFIKGYYSHPYKEAGARAKYISYLSVDGKQTEGFHRPRRKEGAGMIRDRGFLLQRCSQHEAIGNQRAS